MAKTQHFTILLDGEEHHLAYRRSIFWRHVELVIDGERYELPKGAREEPFRLGEEQAILCIRKNGSAAIRTRLGEADET
jgi:hypothetical protein